MTSLYMDSYNAEKPPEGTITFTGAQGEVKLKLQPHHCNKILKIMAEALIEQAQEAAANLTAAVHEAASGNLLEHRE